MIGHIILTLIKIGHIYNNFTGTFSLTRYSYQVKLNGVTQFIDTCRINATLRRRRHEIRAGSYLSLVTDCGLVGELDLCRFEDCVLLQNRRLTLVVTERLLAVEALVEDHSHAPHVHLTTDLWWVLADYETLWWQVPVKVTLLLSKQVFTCS